MLNSINEISISLGVSKMTIYRKLKVKELKSHIILKQGIQYIDDNGLTMLIGMLKPSRESVKCDVKEECTTNITNDEIATDKADFISSLKSEIDFLRSELQEKNIQINNLSMGLSSEQELHKNTQILFKQQQPQQILQLEAHFEELDNKLIEIKDKMKDKQKDHKGIFKKIFSK
ncbi:hypothetical protein [Clostridium estertheticum]|uniref:hypothetical protein n=1 Tax=Clostridium estertheticum TaxID=238834 RepID=UPI001CF2672B|nr:hypothetical protein [Clostridium estertheticum]MCB2357153.1 hypothetical protein [Clostridium estertheticum]WAG44054.1 hypothetical protein LL065_26190 [Clostridium estertheticum]